VVFGMMQETVLLSGMRRTVMRFEKKYMCMYLRVGMSELKTFLSFRHIYILSKVPLRAIFLECRIIREGRELWRVAAELCTRLHGV
jgi:hypothetical protein